mmetsp:Transcript_12164/g.29409  ORF Transcript_12164/g.29409 Transcript_12164/m.29409 type:complete len:414 (+) Transcript_12164:320-1561(+)
MSEEEVPAEAPAAEEGAAPAAEEGAAPAEASLPDVSDAAAPAPLKLERSLTRAAEENSLKVAFLKAAREGSEPPVVEAKSVADILADIKVEAPADLSSIISNVVGLERDELDFSDFLTVCGVIRGLFDADKSAVSPHSLTKSRRVGYRKSFLENGRLTEDEAVLGFLRALEEHRRKCEKEGKYMEARVATKRLHDLKVHEEQKRKEEVRQRHLSERLESERAFGIEQEQHNKLWEEKVMEYEAWVGEQMERLKRLHIAKFEEFRAEAEVKVPRRPQFSKDLLNQKKIQDNLAKQRKYVEAEKLRDINDKVELAEMQATISTYEAEVSLKGQQLRVKQVQEMDALITRADRTRHEMRITRSLDFERRKQRFRNIMNELENAQKLENVQLEYFLDQQTLAGKRNPMEAARNAPLA